MEKDVYTLELSVQTSVDGNHVAGDVSCLWAAQESDTLCHLLWSSKPICRNSLLQCRFVKSLNHVSLDKARGNGVAGNVLLGNLLGKSRLPFGSRRKALRRKQVSTWAVFL